MKYCMIVLITIIAGSVFAQTEISGEVSGVWTSDDSPYIVVDSTWVAEGDTLTIEAGVTVKFNPGIGLDVMGVVFANGTEDDSVKFLSNDEEEHWQGIWFHRFWELEPTLEQAFEYCSVRECEDGFIITARNRVVLRHCLVVADSCAVGRKSYDYTNDNYASSYLLDSCRLYGNKSARARRIEAYDSFIHCFNENGGGIGYASTIERCTIYGGVWGARLLLIDSQFLAYPNGTPVQCRVSDHSIIENCVIEGSIQFNPGGSPYGILTNSEIGHPDIPTALGIEDVYLISTNNIITGSISVRRGSVFFVDCVIELNPSSFGTSILPDDGDVSRFENCVFGQHPTIPSRTIFLFSDYRNDSLIIDHCLIKGKVKADRGSDGCEVVLTNNTMVMSAGQYGVFMLPAVPEDAPVMTNNIFFSTNDSLILFQIGGAEPHPTYNCAYGWGSLTAFQIHPDFRLDSTNLQTDPLFISYDPVDPHLTGDSPCIDAGDPNSPLDPDGTRADMGAFYFHHEVNVKGILGDRPEKFEITATYPNPFNDRLYIRFRLPVSSMVEVQLYDVSGRLVRHVPKRAAPYGEQVWSLDGSGLASGKYYLTMKMRHEEVMRAITLIR